MVLGFMKMYLKLLVVVFFEHSFRLFKSLNYRNPEYEIRYTLGLIQSVWCVFQVNSSRGAELGGARGGVLVKALRYKPAGRGFIL